MHVLNGQVQVLEGQVQVSSTGVQVMEGQCMFHYQGFYCTFRTKGWHNRGPGASFEWPGASFIIRGCVAPFSLSGQNKAVVRYRTSDSINYIGS